MLYYSLSLTKPSALGQHLFATHTHALCPFRSHTHRRARIEWCPKEQDWLWLTDNVAPAQLPMALSVNFGQSLLHLFFIAPTQHITYILYIAFLTLFKRRSVSILLSNKQEQRNHELPINILQQNVSKGTQEASLATLITPEHGPISRPPFAKTSSRRKHFTNCRL